LCDRMVCVLMRGCGAIAESFRSIREKIGVGKCEENAHLLSYGNIGPIFRHF
jgi:hypothetical protein